MKEIQGVILGLFMFFLSFWMLLAGNNNIVRGIGFVIILGYSAHIEHEEEVRKQRHRNYIRREARRRDKEEEEILKQRHQNRIQKKARRRDNKK